MIGRAALALCLFTPLLSYAHVGAGPVSGFVSGIAHPFGGMDHLLAMLAIGIWAAQMGQRSLWVVPLAFVSAMTLGGALGISGITISFGEQGIVASLLVLGILIAAAIRLPLAACAALAGAFAIFHGLIHGAEMPGNTPGATYSLGLVFATAALHMSGIGFSLLVRRISRPLYVRAAGFFIAMFGGYLYLAG